MGNPGLPDLGVTILSLSALLFFSSSFSPLLLHFRLYAYLYLSQPFIFLVLFSPHSRFLCRYFLIPVFFLPFPHPISSVLLYNIDLNDIFVGKCCSDREIQSTLSGFLLRVLFSLFDPDISSDLCLSLRNSSVNKYNVHGRSLIIYFARVLPLYRVAPSDKSKE